jgi:2-amino-4-hydroxy-6-hydroxymethyldihydropteridine diphosphokinase
MMTSAETHTAYIGLGSNLDSTAGTPAETIEAALSALEGLGEIIARSSLYETAPVGMTEQPSFVNAVAALKMQDSPEVLLQKLLKIELDFGRDRKTSVAKGPRTLDLDLLLVNGFVVNTPELSLPHPALAERRFVLAPLAEIAPELRHPVLHSTIRDLFVELPDIGANSVQSVRILSGPSVE